MLMMIMKASLEPLHLLTHMCRLQDPIIFARFRLKMPKKALVIAP